ncbi:acyl-CoA dehydrogenase family protein [Burkholderia lata]|uniref:acyl-CoA dehydrogenase family protein n=1 Tax=Burkholderia lata (strain ATCC 17760 / DSM 23089 / LMG 22485 / NCIMB 9086 / R18194 / 383) TaxID=482957 RepID=UPI0014535B08|nr:acyl-CoA dehydrogenase [Burkholderia lata]VWB21542.1 acyl-CoA dehydrogenase [Burkholderia lata]
MDFTYSEEQQMMADSLRRFVETEYAFERRRKRSREAGAFDRAVWASLGELGVLGLAIDADHGGFGEGPASRLVVQRELGRGLALEPVVPSAVVAGAVFGRYGSDAQKQAWLPAIASGEQIISVAYLEPESRYCADAVRTAAERSGDGYVITGRKALAWHGEVADALLVTARIAGSGDIGLFVVPRDATGVTVTGYPTMDGLRAADVGLDGVTVAADALIEGGLDALQHGIDHGIAALCAEASGAMERLIEITAEYLRTRQQFGKPLGAFQALQHRMADMLIQKEIALSMAYVAALALDEAGSDERTRKIAAAKVMVAKAGRFVGQQAVQLHGGMGMTDELEVGDYFKRLTMFDPLFGDSDYQMARYTAAMV